MNACMVIGASGQIGEHLVDTLKKGGKNVVATHHRTSTPNSELLDIRKADDAQRLVEMAKPDVVYLTAATTHVDFCEQNPAESYEVNVIGAKNIVAATNYVGARLVYFSSDYIFDGKSGPYSEDALPNPINEYGKQKLIAEHYIALFSRNHLIIRTTVVYGWERQGKNFVVRLLKTLEKNQEAPAPIDQIGNPTYAPNLAQASIELAESGAKGVFNLVGPELCSRYEFACEAAQAFNLPTKLIRPVTTDSLNQVALRPLKAGMKIEKAAAILKSSPVGYREGLKLMVASKGIKLA